MSRANWVDLAYPPITADGAAVSATTTETIMVPDYSVPAFFMEPNRTLRYTLAGKISTVITTPGTIIHRLRWGGIGGTILAASGAYAPDPTAASTDLSFRIEWEVTCRTSGTAGSMMCMGMRWLTDYDNASATTIGANLDMMVMPQSSPAAVASLDTTIAKALSPTVQFSVNTSGTATTTMMAFLEALN